jgi:hypothetical protein
MISAQRGYGLIDDLFAALGALIGGGSEGGEKAHTCNKKWGRIVSCWPVSNRLLHTERPRSGSADEIGAQLAKLPHKAAGLQPAVTGETACPTKKSRSSNTVRFMGACSTALRSRQY